MSCYIRKLLPRGSSILSGAPFTTSSSRPRLMGPPSQLVSRKITLRPVQGPRHYSRQPNDDGGKGFWAIKILFFELFLFGTVALSLSAYVIWNIRPSHVNQRRNKPIYDLLVGDVPVNMECRDETVVMKRKSSVRKSLPQLKINSLNRSLLMT